ncbi:hypothetical protein XENOCAPTIV_012865 [Xenoophorus captivus]|uniref:VWFD domain-containing protein n=1 Tax=Xenoophorus captivus TaxID=1517983 RepID=A0ABV0SHC9_9TELE
MSPHRHWFLDTIPATGTPAAIRLIQEKFMAEEISVAEAVQALVAAVHMVTADPEVIKLFQNLIASNKVVENPLLREVVFLGYGSLMLGAAATAFYINNAATFLPKTVVAKTRAFFAGSTAEVLEYGKELPIQEYGREALKALLLSDINFHYAKPVLAAEVRRILPTAAGLPMELSLYSAAVAAASVESERDWSCFFKPCSSPQSENSVYNVTVRLPMSMPIDEIKGLSPFDEVIDRIHFMVSKAVAAECSFSEDTLYTFNNRSYKDKMPSSCYKVAAQDCTDELKFMVLLRKDSSEQHHINVKISEIDIDMYPKDNNVIVKVNEMEIPPTSLPYRHPTASIEIRQSGEGLAVYAPSHGLQEVYFDRKTWKIKVADWMKGKTCGLCGKADGEVRQEYHTPNGRVAKNSVSFAHSWILPANSCRDASGKTKYVAPSFVHEYIVYCLLQ